MEQDDDADYDRKLSQLRREEELINEEAKEAAAFLQTDIPVLIPGQVCIVFLCCCADVLLHAVASRLPEHCE